MIVIRTMSLARLYLILLWITSMGMLGTLTYITNMFTVNQTHVPKCLIRQQLLGDEPRYLNLKNMPRDNSSDAEWRLQWPESESNLTVCKLEYKVFKGRINLSSQSTSDDVYDAEYLSKVKYGGVYRPANCVNKESVAIIIPYRNRKHQLDTLVNLLHVILQKQKQTYGIYVVEMSLPIQFNRGLLANAGYLTAKSIGNYTCYIIHDVDLLPINDRNMYKCGKLPKHMVTFSSKYEDGTLPYSGYIGGVLAMTDEQFVKVNGFSNLYFGWGAEDDDMYTRIVSTNMSIERNPSDVIASYMALQHSSDQTNPPNPHRQTLLDHARYRYPGDGLNSLSYHREALEFRPLYTWMLINVIESEIYERFGYVRADNELLWKNKKKQVKTKVKIIQENGNNKFQYTGRNAA